MNCTEFEVALERAVETREPLATTTLEHVANCAACREIWEAQQRLNAAIVAWKFAVPPTGLADAVLAKLAWEDDSHAESSSFWEGEALAEPSSSWEGEAPAEPSSPLKATVQPPVQRVSPLHGSAGASPSRNREARSGLLVMATVAACLVVAVVFTAQFSRNPNHNLAQNIRFQPVNSIGSDLPVDVTGTLTTVMSDLQTEYREMANETTAMAWDMVSGIPHPVSVSTIPISDDIELLPKSDDMVRILQPIGNGVESALGFLWKAIPGEVPPG